MFRMFGKIEQVRNSRTQKSRSINEIEDLIVLRTINVIYSQTIKPPIAFPQSTQS